jgi:feruloyl esterase
MTTFASLSRGVAAIVLLAAALAPAAHAAAPKPNTQVAAVQSCASLSRVDLTDIGGAGSRVTSTMEGASNGAPACTVEATLAPAVKLRVVLPTRTWTQRLLQVGCGGLCGNIPAQVGAADGCVPLNTGGFVIAATDMGHEGQGGTFGRDPQLRADFAYRGVHITALAAKKLTAAFYGKPASYAYFTGCSDGGREALVEAQRYPYDFDGIIAGAAAMNFDVQNGLYHAWQARSNTGADGKAILTAPRVAILHRAVLAQCDALDGQQDGLLADPRACHVDLAAITCKADAKDNADCLTPVETEAARRLYDGPRDPQTGQRLTAGGPMPGSELGWIGVFVPRNANEPIFSEMIALDALRNMLFETNPPADFKLADLHFDRATFDLLRARHPLFDATNPDLAPFAAHGGKLIVWQGWSDPHISPLNTIAYHEAVQRQMGTAQAAAFERLFLLPGVYHCSGGEGPSAIDFLTPMLDWVERGIAPRQVVAHTAAAAQRNTFGQPGMPAGAKRMGPPPGMMPPESANVTPRARPVFAYPAIAKWDGKGEANQAASYVEGQPITTGTIGDWAGADFYQPYAPREQ